MRAASSLAAAGAPARCSAPSLAAAAGLALLLLVAAAPAAAAGAAPPPRCAGLTATNSTDYWTSVAACAPCLTAGCGFSLASLVCVEASAAPDDATLQGPPQLCPAQPACAEYLACGDCLAHSPDCAWCGREAVCLLSSAAHTGDAPCTAVQYQAPCRSPQDRECVGGGAAGA